MSFTTNLLITTSNSIQLQSSSLAQLTQATNQLTRTAAVKILISLSFRNFYFYFSNRQMHQINVIN
jgi:hypothetical protein